MNTSRSFNSLFEMRPTAQKSDEGRRHAVSILYLRCKKASQAQRPRPCLHCFNSLFEMRSAVSARRWFGVLVVSILYLRCAWRAMDDVQKIVESFQFSI